MTGLTISGLKKPVTTLKKLMRGSGYMSIAKGRSIPKQNISQWWTLRAGRYRLLAPRDWRCRPFY